MPFRIKKILKVDYLRGRAKEYYANFISAKKPKIEFSLFHPTVSHSTDISPKFRGDDMEPRGKASGNYLIKEKTSTSLSLTVTLSGVEGCIQPDVFKNLAKLNDIESYITKYW